MDIWALPGYSWFLILLNYWNSPNQIVPDDTYIIFEQHLGAMLFAWKLSKNINTFLSLEAKIIVLTTSNFIGFLFPGQIRHGAIYVRKQIMNQFCGWRYARFLFNINFSSYHWLQLFSVQTDSFRVRSDFISMYVRIVFALCWMMGNRDYITRNIFSYRTRSLESPWFRTIQ